MNDIDARLAGIGQRLDILGRALTDRLAEWDAKIAALQARLDEDAVRRRPTRSHPR